MKSGLFLFSDLEWAWSLRLSTVDVLSALEVLEKLKRTGLILVKNGEGAELGRFGLGQLRGNRQDVRCAMFNGRVEGDVAADDPSDTSAVR